ncbi:MAG: hypothetical protein WC969_04005 [Elusimicrobiota bacterium]|jgi:hypothetical protein
MKCLSCQQDNKDNAKVCKRCGRDMTLPPAWMPDWKWHARTLGVIYVCLTVLYFGLTLALKTLPAPYQLRKIPPEMTPWLKR